MRRTPPRRGATRAAIDALVDRGRGEDVGLLLDLLAATPVDSDAHERILARLPDLGRRVLDASLARLALQADPAHRASLGAILARLGERDDRILAALVALFSEDPFLGAFHFADYGDTRALPLLAEAIVRFDPSWTDEDPIGALRVLVHAYETLAGSLPDSLRASAKRVRLLCGARARGSDAMS